MSGGRPLHKQNSRAGIAYIRAREKVEEKVSIILYCYGVTYTVLYVYR